MQSDVVGIFATHQQDLVDHRLKFLEAVQRVYCCCMEVQEDHRRMGRAGDLPWFKPTFRVLKGTSRHSLALQVGVQEVLDCANGCLTNLSWFHYEAPPLETLPAGDAASVARVPCCCHIDMPYFV